MKKERDLSIDFFRFIGMTAIIFAHSDPSHFLFQIRNFDVPLMVFVSGYSAFNFSSKSNDLPAYMKDRFLRLVVPTWIFMTLYLVIRQSLGDGVSTGDVIESYLMTGGGPVGVWIIRVFFFMSLLTPMMVRLAKKETSHFLLFGFLIFILAANEIASQYFGTFAHPRTIPVRMVYIFLLYNCSYGLVLYLGAIWGKLKKKEQIFFTTACLICFLSLATHLFYANGKFIWTQSFKNPPMLYYLSYALLIICILFLIKNTWPVKALSRNRFTTFIGSHTLWIYLWHWLFLYGYDKFFPSVDLWLFKFFFTFTGATLITLLQVRIFGKLAPTIPLDYRTVLKKIFIG